MFNPIALALTHTLCLQETPGKISNGFSSLEEMRAVVYSCDVDPNFLLPNGRYFIELTLGRYLSSKGGQKSAQDDEGLEEDDYKGYSE